MSMAAQTCQQPKTPPAASPMQGLTHAGSGPASTSPHSLEVPTPKDVARALATGD